MNKKNILLHLLFWVLLMLSFAISEWTYRNTFFDAIVFELLFLPVRALAVYTNWFVLTPKLLYKNKLVIYIVSVVGLLFLLGIIQRVFVLYYGYPAFFPEWVEGQEILVLRFTRIVQNVLIIGTPVAFTTGWKVYIDLKKRQAKTKELEKEKTESELKYLKSQINPHFLFNTLNTIYGLSLENSKKTPELILKLSDFLSFSLYESNQSFIPISKEIALMNDFIALEKSRFEDRVAVTLSIPNSVENVLIPPLTFVPFVENAFKHSLKNETEIATITIRLTCKEKQLTFSVLNSKPENSLDISKNKGLGLINIRKRLDIIYGNNYDLEINDSPAEFSIILNITHS